MISVRLVLQIVFCTATISACVFKNDLDYPLVPGNITEIEVEGQKEVKIDKASKTVTIVLEETADISHLKVKKISLSEGAVMAESIGEFIDLKSPIKLLIKTYQDYEWTIRAEQKIERYVNCDNQIGNAIFNTEDYSILVKVTDFQPLSSLNIKDVKLGPTGSVVKSTTGYRNKDGNIVYSTEECSFPIILDCVLERTFTVLYNGNKTVWKFKAIQIETKASIVSVRPWCYHAKVRATFGGSGTPYIEYKKTSDGQWIKANNANIAGVGVTVDIKGLSENTDYLVRINDKGEYSQEFAFRTDSPVQLYNMSFDEWHLNGKIWYPYPSNASAEQKIWDSANKATGSFIGSSTTPEDNFTAVKGEGKKAVKLESNYAVVKFAAATLYIGKFVGMKGLGAELSWGIPFTSRPSALKGFYSYSPTKINYTDQSHKNLMGQEDKAHVILILTDWEAPFHVISNEEKFVDFDNDPAIIGYAKLPCINTGKEYKDFSINIQYRNERIPKWVSIIATSSALGDYFTGGTGSILYLDEFSFVYE